MARRHATGKFYFLLILVLVVVAYLLYQRMPQGAAEGIVSIATSTDTRSVDAVIVRDEQIVSYDGLERVEYRAAEGQMVYAGDEIAEIYTTSYISKELSKLNSTRDSIRTYQRNLFATANDPTLDRLDVNVDTKAQELKRLVSGRTTGSLENLEEQLTATMQARQSWLSTNKLEETKLIQLYQDENNRLGSIATWKKSAAADTDGIVSFYFDGYESLLNGRSFLSLSGELLRKVTNNDSSVVGKTSSRSEQVYRIVSTDEWYIALLSRDASWNPVTGQQLRVQMKGFEDLVYTGTVVGVQRSGADTVIQLSCTDPIGPLLYQRSGRAEVGIYTEGLSVPAKAIYRENNQPGVWVRGNYGVSFVPVDILSQDNDNVIVQPMQSDALYEGQTVMIY